MSYHISSTECTGILRPVPFFMVVYAQAGSELWCWCVASAPASAAAAAGSTSAVRVEVNIVYGVLYHVKAVYNISHAHIPVYPVNRCFFVLIVCTVDLYLYVHISAASVFLWKALSYTYFVLHVQDVCFILYRCWLRFREPAMRCGVGVAGGTTAAATGRCICRF